MFYKRVVLKNVTQFTGKHYARVSFLTKLQAKACNFIIKEVLSKVFSSEFCKIFKNAIFYRTLLVAASVCMRQETVKKDLRVSD